MSISYASGDGLTMPAKLRNLIQAQKPDIKISLASRKKTYSTMDKIEGTVSITAPADTHFDAVDIEFVGTSRTYVERLTTAAAVSGRSEAFHQFLKLTQPNVEQHYPENRLLKAGQTYDFPFVFAVPQQLLPRVCQHRTINPSVRDAHLLLPPTFGDKDSRGKTDVKDDLAPDMASIRYGVFAKVSRVKTNGDESHRVSLASKARKVRVIPAVDEQPPLHTDGDENEYTMHKEKNIRKGMLKGKSGTLVMEAAQPQSFRLSCHNSDEVRVTTMATVMLRFDPADEKSAPPRLNNLSSKLKACTFFASTARQNFPTKVNSMLDVSQGVHTEHITLSSRCMASVEWISHDPLKPNTIERRDSACSTSSLAVGDAPAPSTSYKGKKYYTARLLVPLTLPANKTFVPTFHSCLISRIYQLKLDLSISGTGGIQPSMELKMPIQVSAEATSGDQSPPHFDSLDSDPEAEIEVDDVHDFFGPRTIRQPSEGFIGRSRIGSQAPTGEGDAPPGYSAFAPARHPSAPSFSYQV